MKNDGVIDIHEFQKALGFKESDCARRIFSAFDGTCNRLYSFFTHSKIVLVNGDRYINFEEFCMGLSIYCGKVSLAKKIECMSSLV